MFKRLIYLPYYVAKTPSGKFIANVTFVKKAKKVSSFRIIGDVLFCSLRYNISFLDYFSLRFFELDYLSRRKFMGSGAMYEFHLKMNPRKHRQVLENKIMFLKKFNDLAGRSWTTIDIIREDSPTLESFLKNPTGKIVLKNAMGQAGKEVQVCSVNDFNAASLIKTMEKGRFNLLETYVVQHDRLMNLSPSGLNTVRLMTQYYDNNVFILSARLRIIVNSATDNMAAGNIAAHVNMQTGKVAAPAVYLDISKESVTKHPVTNVEIVGFEIPFWNECIELVKKAACRIPENRSIGWDVAITNNGPILIEGNHNWSYLLWQMPEQKGGKKVIKHINELYNTKGELKF